MEAAGGFRAGRDLIIGWVAADREAKLAAVTSGSRTIIGGNKYPNPNPFLPSGATVDLGWLGYAALGSVAKA